MENSNKPIFTALSTELLSPVLNIQKNIESLKNHSIYRANEFSEETFSLAEDAIKNILGLIENFQFLNNSDQLKKNLNPQWFSLPDLISQVKEELRIFNLDTSRINLIALPHHLDVFLDKFLINRILVNLLSNALKFSSKKVELNISVIKNNLTITVRDYGIGIPDSQLDAIFDPFVKCQNANKFPGTGIGLSIVARAVESLEGTASVHSYPEKETEFQVVIPYHHSRRTDYKPQNKRQLIRNKIQSHYD